GQLVANWNDADPVDSARGRSRPGDGSGAKLIQSDDFIAVFIGLHGKIGFDDKNDLSRKAVDLPLEPAADNVIGTFSIILHAAHPGQGIVREARARRWHSRRRFASRPRW